MDGNEMGEGSKGKSSRICMIYLKRKVLEQTWQKENMLSFGVTYQIWKLLCYFLYFSFIILFQVVVKWKVTGMSQI